MVPAQKSGIRTRNGHSALIGRNYFNGRMLARHAGGRGSNPLFRSIIFTAIIPLLCMLLLARHGGRIHLVITQYNIVNEPVAFLSALSYNKDI